MPAPFSEAEVPGHWIGSAGSADQVVTGSQRICAPDLACELLAGMLFNAGGAIKQPSATF
jgi:hypothetical protein